MAKRKGISYKVCPKCGEQNMVRGSKTKSGQQRWICRKRGVNCYQTTDPDSPPRGTFETKAPEKKIQFAGPRSRKRLVITWAQNATPIHQGFFRALQAYCKARKATLLVMPGRYKNPSSFWPDSQANAQWWEPELVPFLINQRRDLNRNLTLLADINVQPTAVSPLTGFESITHGESGILPHPKLQLRTVPTPQNRLPKILTTTGAVTIENYTDTKAGKKGEFHHVLGAAVVEIADDSIFHLRQINATEEGAFIDLDKAYYPDGRVADADYTPALVFGDAHYRFADPEVVKATFGPRGLVAKLNPEQLVWHDLLDGYAVNPHHEGHPFIKFAKHKAKFDNIRVEILETIRWMLAMSHGRTAVVVPSNHDNMLYRWLERTDWRQDPENAEFYLETALQLVRSAAVAEHGADILDPFQWWVQRLAVNSHNVKTMLPAGSYTIKGIELALHGHEGPNGARGTLKNLSAIGAKVISGHSHSPGIEAGHYKAGTMTPLSLEYTGPVGSWLNTHVSIDSFGKRHLHNCIDGRFWA